MPIHAAETPSCVADEHDRGEIGGAECECGHPRTDLVAAEDEVIDTFGFLRCDQTDCHHDGGIDHNDDQRDDL